MIMTITLTSCIAGKSGRNKENKKKKRTKNNNAGKQKKAAKKKGEYAMYNFTCKA